MYIYIVFRNRLMFLAAEQLLWYGRSRVWSAPPPPSAWELAHIRRLESEEQFFFSEWREDPEGNSPAARPGSDAVEVAGSAAGSSRRLDRVAGGCSVAGGSCKEGEADRGADPHTLVRGDRNGMGGREVGGDHVEVDGRERVNGGQGAGGAGGERGRGNVGRVPWYLAGVGQPGVQEQGLGEGRRKLADEERRQCEREWEAEEKTAVFDQVGNCGVLGPERCRAVVWAM